MFTKYASSHTPGLSGVLHARGSVLFSGIVDNAPPECDRGSCLAVALATRTCSSASSAGLDCHCANVGLYAHTFELDFHSVNLFLISCKSDSEMFLVSVRSTIRIKLDA
jgi:hypothetical protein